MNLFILFASLLLLAPNINAGPFSRKKQQAPEVTDGMSEEPLVEIGDGAALFEKKNCQPAGESYDQKLEKRVVELHCEDLHITAPYFENNAVYTEDRKILDRNMFATLRAVLEEASKELFVAKTSVVKFGASFLGNAKSVMKKSLAELHEFEKKDTSTPIRKYFVERMVNLVEKCTIQKSKDSKIAGPKLNELVLELLDNVQVLIQASPVGFYLDWNETKINGKPIAEVQAPVVQSMRDSHLGWAFPIFITLSKFLVWMF